MNEDQRYSRLTEESWRRELSPSEAAELRVWLAKDPEAQQDLEMDVALTKAFGELPDVPIPSNFTSLVLKAVKTPAPKSAGAGQWLSEVWRCRWRWLPKASFAGLLLGAGLFSYVQLHQAERSRLVRSVTTVSELASMPTAEMLRDFDAIRALNRAPGADEDLIRLLQ